MICGIGTDLIEVDRIAKLVARGRRYLEAVFTEKEMDYCETKARKSEHYAARYAAKEALLKALGCGWRDGLAFTDIEIINDQAGKPEVALRGAVKKVCDDRQIKQVSVSLTHNMKMAMALIILEK